MKEKIPKVSSGYFLSSDTTYFPYFSSLLELIACCTPFPPASLIVLSFFMFFSFFYYNRTKYNHCVYFASRLSSSNEGNSSDFNSIFFSSFFYWVSLKTPLPFERYGLPFSYSSESTARLTKTG